MKRLTSILAAVALLAAGRLSAQEIQNFRVSGPVVSPEVTATSVTFRLRAPQASDVRVQPSWLGYGPEAAEAGKMVKGDDGVWTKTFDRPASELYTYTFSVDGVSTLDPSNVFVQRDGVRFMSALLIDGGLGDLYKESERAGNLDHVWYWSGTPGMYRRMYVYTPFGYDPNDKSRAYPVLYLLHGGGGDEDAWSTLGRTCQILDNLIARGEAQPMLVVMPNGNPTQRAARTLMVPENPDVPKGNGSFDNYASLPADIVPYIESHYNVIKDRSGRALAGLSMGGGQTFYTGFRHIDMFSSLGIFSSGLLGGRTGAFDAEKEMPGIYSDPSKFYSRLKVLYISCGEQDERLEGTREVVAKLRGKGYTVVWETCPGGHEWKVWRINLASFVRRIFK
ncbi:MAG: esterase [Bacteroidales bacterium]|nr:esterase [Bacteroidales bacterium]